MAGKSDFLLHYTCLIFLIMAAVLLGRRAANNARRIEQFNHELIEAVIGRGLNCVRPCRRITIWPCLTCACRSGCNWPTTFMMVSSVQAGLSIGISSMKARIARLNGTFAVQSEPGRTLLQATLPLSRS